MVDWFSTSQVFLMLRAAHGDLRLADDLGVDGFLVISRRKRRAGTSASTQMDSSDSYCPFAGVRGGFKIWLLTIKVS